LTKGNLGEIRVIRWGHPPYSPNIAGSDFWDFGWSENAMKEKVFLSREAVEIFLFETWGKMDRRQLFNMLHE
jgi:hypothetical protein